MSIFEVTSKLGRKLRLTEIQWAHISYKHPELNNQLQKMISVLENPDFIYYSSNDDCYQYIKYFEQTPISKKYLLVIVRHLNSEGFVITAFFCSKIKKTQKEAIYEKENFHKL